MPFWRRDSAQEPGVTGTMADEHGQAPDADHKDGQDTGLPADPAAGTGPDNIVGAFGPPDQGSPARHADSGQDQAPPVSAQPGGAPQSMSPGGGPDQQGGVRQTAGRSRETVQVQPAVAPGGAPKASDSGFPATAVLVGNPRLGSNPGRLPGVTRPAPDSTIDGAEYPGFVARAASLRGDDHRLSGDLRQDSIGLWGLDGAPGLDNARPALLACVADGVGSQPMSHLGSAEACALLRDRVAASLPELLGPRDPAPRIRQVIGEVAQGLRDYAAQRDLDPKALSTTLMAALIVPRYQQHGAAADLFLFGVGDSRGFRLQEGTWTQIPAAAPSDQGVISTSTDALPTRPEATVIHTCTLYAEDVLMICSDGLSNPLALNESVRTRLADWWGGAPPSLPEFYWQMSFRAQTYGDDRSAVCIWINDGR